jgi:hypothetical protein
MKGTLRRDMILKSGRTFKKGDEYEIIPPTKQQPCYAFMAVDVDLQIPISINKLYRYFYQFQESTMSDLEDGVYDSVTHTVTGEPVEPDGWDQYGFPSPLIAMGMI